MFIKCFFIADLKKLIKYEQKSKPTPSDNVPKIVHAPENVINVTIIKEATPKKNLKRSNENEPKSVRRSNNQEQEDSVQPKTRPETEESERLSRRLSRLPSHIKNKNRKVSTGHSESETEEPVKIAAKKLVRLPSHVKNKNPKIVWKKGIVTGGVFVRNTPTDLYQKYQEDWTKFKSFIPGENDRQNVRRSIRKKMQQKDEDDAKVCPNLELK